MTILIVATMAVWALTTIIAFTRNDKQPADSVGNFRT